MGNKENMAEELFLNVRKSTRLLYEYQHRVQGTMFHIKQLLNLSPSDRIEVNKLFSNPPQRSQYYGQFRLRSSNWAWDFLFPMAMQYYLGRKETEDKNHWFRMSVIVVTDDGFFKAAQEGAATKAQRTDTATFKDVIDSDTVALFLMEVEQFKPEIKIKQAETEWKKRWSRNTVDESLENWLTNPQSIIKNETDNNFIVMRFKLSELVTKEDIDNVLNQIRSEVKNITRCDI